MNVIQPWAAVCLVFALLGGALFALKKRGVAAFRLPRLSSPGARRMEIIERVSLGPQHTLHLVRVGERSLVIATSPSTCQMVCEAPSMEVRN